jgi:hypothetical protein
MELPGNIALLCGAVAYIFVSRQLGIDFIIPGSRAGFCARMVLERPQGNARVCAPGTTPKWPEPVYPAS